MKSNLTPVPITSSKLKMCKDQPNVAKEGCRWYKDRCLFQDSTPLKFPSDYTCVRIICGGLRYLTWSKMIRQKFPLTNTSLLYEVIIFHLHFGSSFWGKERKRMKHLKQCIRTSQNPYHQLLLLSMLGWMVLTKSREDQVAELENKVAAVKARLSHKRIKDAHEHHHIEIPSAQYFSADVRLYERILPVK